MKEGQISHAEVNQAIAAAEKTIIFGRQTRVCDGVLLEGEEKLPRFHIGHDQVKFFYSAVRQLPEYLLDALLARNVSVTLIAGRGLCCFKDVRNHQAVHCGYARRTIYLPEKILDVAFRNGYDYWSITQVLITEGWKLLDFALLHDLVRAAKKIALRRRVSVLGYNAVRRILRQRNRHRSAYESPELIEKKEAAGLDVPINELEEFVQEYEERLLRAMRFGGDGRLGKMLEKPFAAMEPHAIARALYNEHQEEIWAARKAGELAEEQNFPDYFLLDRDVVHPAAYEMAEVYGLETEPQDMGEARHDYRDALRFEQLPGRARELLCERAAQFGPQGIEGLVEEVAAAIFADGRFDGKLAEVARRVLGGMASARKNFYVYLQSGMDLVRLREVLAFCAAVRSGARRLYLEDVEFLRPLLIALASGKAKRGDMRRIDLINAMQKVDELFAQLVALLLSEARRLLDGSLGRKLAKEELDEALELLVQREGVWPGGEEAVGCGVLVGVLEAELERAVVRASLCLDLYPEYGRMVGELVARGGRAEEIVEAFVEGAAQDEEQQVVVVNARRALEAARTARGEAVEEGEMHEDAEMLAELPGRVRTIVEMLPEKTHTCTSTGKSALRRALKEFEDLHRRFPTSPDQLGPLAMVLVRLDQSEVYEELLEQVRWMGQYAIGQRVQRGVRVWYTAGLLRVIDEERPGSGPVAERAAELVRELADEEAGRALEQIR